MGMERWYVAVVDGCRLLERAWADPAFGEYVALPGDFGRGRWQHAEGGSHAEFLAEVDAMNRSHPGIEDRVYTLGRAFDMAHYLLSESRRRGEFGGTDLGTKAILGSTGLPGHLRGLQGHPIRYSTLADVREVAAWLGGLTTEAIRSVYSPKEMERQAVYKFWADRADDRIWKWIVMHFEGLRSFYADAAAHGEGVLAIVT